MIKNRCLVCGSSNMRADRALSGRLVCNSCGTPLGVKRAGNNKSNYFSIFSLNRQHLLFLFILIISFILVVII